MKKKCICILAFILTIISTTLGVEFYDTLDTKYEGAVEALYELGIVDGTSKGVYSPNTYVTRAQLAKLLVGAYGYENIKDFITSEDIKFTDVKEGEWYYNYVGVASCWGVINGYEDGTFKPDKNVTYAEAVTMIIRALGYDNIKPDSVHGWEYNYINKMRQLMLNKNLPIEDTSALANRGDIAILIWNMMSQKSYIEIEENTTTGLTWAEVGEKLIERAYEDYTTIEDARITDIYYKDGKYYIELNGNTEYEIVEPIKNRMLGALITALYNKKTEKLVAIANNSSNNFDEGYVDELEEEYKLSQAKSYGEGKDYAYVYFNEEGAIERVVYIDFGENIYVRTKKIDKENIEVEKTKEDGTIEKVTKKEEYILINDTEKIYITNTVLLDPKSKIVSWSNLPVDSVLTSMNQGSYYMYSTSIKTGTVERYFKNNSKPTIKIDGSNYLLSEGATYLTYEEEKSATDNKKKVVLKEISISKMNEYLEREAEIYFSCLGEVVHVYYTKDQEVSNLSNLLGVVETEPKQSAGSGKYMLTINNAEGQKTLYLDKSLRTTGLYQGTFILYSKDGSTITNYKILEKTGSIDSDLKIEFEITNKEYTGSKIGKYNITEDTEIYLVTQEYETNSNLNVKNFKVELCNKSILEKTENQKIHVIYDKNQDATTVIVIKELNKFDYLYARVTEVTAGKVIINKKEVNGIKIKIIPVGYKTETYVVTDLTLDCYPGELIAYTIKDDVLIVNEVYKKSVIGHEKDIVIEKIESSGKTAITTNGDIIKTTEEKFELKNGKEYKWEDYHILVAKVRDWDGYKFVGEEFVETKSLRFKTNDRIAIDELEGVIVIYRGYEE